MDDKRSITSLIREDSSGGESSYDENDALDSLQLSSSPVSDNMGGMPFKPPLLTRLSTQQVQGHVALAGSSFSFARISSTSTSQASAEPGSPIAQSQIQLHDEADGSSIHILKQIGSGSYGRVFLGLLDNEQVAVKAMFEERRRSSTGVTQERKEMENRKNKMLKLEGLLMRLVSGHPNIVTTYKCLSTDPDPSRDLSMTKGAGGKRGSLTGRAKIQGPSGTVAYEWYIVMEFCEQGTIWGHITRGKTHRQRQVSAQGACESGILEPNPNIDPNQQLLILEWDAWASLQFLKEVASALQFLHTHDIVHADLKSDNVLLSSSNIDRRGVTAKLTDFGLSRILKSGSKVKTKTFGTVTHQPPELLKSNDLSPAADIYAFGIFAWELFTMREAHGDLSESEVILGVAAGSLRPSFPSDCPSAYIELVSKCWANCPDDRLTAAELEDELDRVQASFCPRGQDSPWMLLSAFK